MQPMIINIMSKMITFVVCALICHRLIYHLYSIRTTD